MARTILRNLISNLRHVFSIFEVTTCKTCNWWSHTVKSFIVMKITTRFPNFEKKNSQVVGPPPGTNWSARWHNFLHEWNMRVDRRARASGISSWSKKCMIQYWNFASYIANLPAESWVGRALAWKPFPTYPSLRRPQRISDTKLEIFCRYQAFGN